MINTDRTYQTKSLKTIVTKLGGGTTFIYLLSNFMGYIIGPRILHVFVLN